MSDKTKAARALVSLAGARRLTFRVRLAAVQVGRHGVRGVQLARVGWAWGGMMMAWAGVGLLVGMVAGSVVASPNPGQAAAAGGGIGAVIGFGVMWRGRRRPALASFTHGSAAFADARQVESSIGNPALAADPAALLIGRSVGRDRRLLRYTGAQHLSTLMPTRAGKGVGTLLPNLLTARRSVIVVDPKGENARVAARARATMGQVFILDPFGVSGLPTSSYDPTALLLPDSPDLADDAATLADALVFDPPGTTADPHWNESAKSLIGGVLMHVACRVKGEPGGLPELRRLLTLPADAWIALLDAMQANTAAAGGLVARAASQQLGKSDREAAGVLSSAQRHTAFLDSGRISAVSARSDFRFADLREGIATVFLVLPPDRLTTYARWLRLLVSQAVQELARTPQRLGTPPVLLLLDEMASLGRLEPVKQAYAVMAGLGLQVWGMWQDLGQVKAVYGLDASSLLANSGVVQVSAPADLETAKWLSQTLGNSTIQTSSYNSGTSTPTPGLFQQGGSSSISTGVSIQNTGRPLMGPDELMRMDAGWMILLRPGHAPAAVAKLRHHADPEFVGLFESVSTSA